MEKCCDNCLRVNQPVKLYCIRCNRVFPGEKRDFWNNPNVERSANDFSKLYGESVTNKEFRMKQQEE